MRDNTTVYCMNGILKEQLLKIVDDPETPAQELSLLCEVNDFDIREAAMSHPNYEAVV